MLREPLVVSAGSNSPIEITMKDDTAQIEGDVVGISSSVTTGTSQQANPGTAAYIYCVPAPDSAGQFLQLWAGPDGHVISQPMAPGIYRVLAFKTLQPSLPYRDAEAMRAYDSKGQVVNLVPGGKEHLQLQPITGSE